VRTALAISFACFACSTTTGPSYPLHPRVRSASGGPVMLLGAVAHPGAVPYSSGMTFTLALRLAGGPTSFATRAMVKRGTLFFGLPLRDVIDHAAPDPELAPGDIVTLESISD
jgi:protein involved in polysaccharide export with SLBB domain